MKYNRHIIIISVALVLIGCNTPAGGVDNRFSNLPLVLVTELEYPVRVKILKIDDSTYDVEAGEGRALAFTGVNQPLEQLARYEKAAKIVLSAKLGDSYAIERESYLQPAGYANAFFRFRVTALTPPP